MKFRTKKFLDDRNKSLDRSKKGELDLINKSGNLPTHAEIQQKFKVYDSALYDEIMKCSHRIDDIFGLEVCELPFAKRKGERCRDCNLKLS
jgi:hypothetical protein